MSRAPGIFHTFFMAGFECSTFVWKDGERKDYVAKTGHEAHLQADYERIKQLGIGVVREAIRWPLVDKGGGRYDWSSIEPVLGCVAACRIEPIWDLCHYGLPEGCDPFSDECRQRFVDYCRAVAEIVVPRTAPPRFFTPINEITFFAAAATDMQWMYPFAKGRYAELKRALCRMAIAGVDAIRSVDPEARMVHVDPIVHAVAPHDRPDLADEAWDKAYREAYEAWDMLAGTLAPELGGAPEKLDIVGVNAYFFSQAEHQPDGGREILGPRDARRRPLGELLLYAWNRYHRPVIIGETSGYQDRRADWLRMTMEESMKALNSGVDLQGICLYPCVDIPDWNTGEWAKIGIYDVEDAATLERLPCDAYIAELRRWQEILDEPAHLEDDGVDGGAGRVQLAEVREHARRWAASTPGAQTVEGWRGQPPRELSPER
jgi:beta-glucosidase/6-phospho-beta-glucosidase/beta-galactosidase